MLNVNSKNKTNQDYEYARKEFHKLINSLSSGDLRKRSHNPGWTNGEILFHILLGFIVVHLLFPLVMLFGKLPKSWSKIFSGILNASTPVFNVLNAIGARIGGRLLSKKSLEEKFDWVISKILNKLNKLESQEFDRGMYFPDKWDDLFKEFMTIRELFSYPIKHFKFHLKQIRD